MLGVLPRAVGGLQAQATLAKPEQFAHLRLSPQTPRRQPSPDADAADDGHLAAAVLARGDALGLGHQQGAVAAIAVGRRDWLIVMLFGSVRGACMRCRKVAVRPRVAAARLRGTGAPCQMAALPTSPPPAHPMCWWALAPASARADTATAEP